MYIYFEETRRRRRLMKNSRIKTFFFTFQLRISNANVFTILPLRMRNGCIFTCLRNFRRKVDGHKNNFTLFVTKRNFLRIFNYSLKENGL